MIHKTTRPFLPPFAIRQVLALLLLGFLSAAQAADAVKPDTLSQAQAALKQITQQVAGAEKVSAEQLKILKMEIAGIRSSAQNCVQDAEPKIELLDSELAILQPNPTPGTLPKKPTGTQAADQSEAPASPAIARQVQDLLSSKASLVERIATCKLMLLSSNDLNSTVDDYLRSLQKRQLLTRGPNLVSVIQANLDDRDRWMKFAGQLAETFVGLGAIRPVYLLGAVGVVLLGFILGYILGHIVPRQLRARMAKMKIEEEGVSGGLVEALMSSASRYAPIGLALGGIIAYMTFIPDPVGDLRLTVTIMYGLLAYLVIAALIRTLFNPCPPATHYLPLPAEVAISLSRRSRVLAMIALFGWFIQELHADSLLDDTKYLLIQQIVGWLWVLNVIWVVWLLRRLDGWHSKWTFPLLICVALLGGGIAAGLGYVNLGTLVIGGITYTLGLIGLALVVTQFFSDVFDGLDQGRYGWQKAVRRAIGLKDQDYVPGLGWMRLLVNLVLWMGTALMLLHVWITDEDITADIVVYFTQGFQVAGLTIVPLHLLLAILVLALMLTLIGWIKGRLNSKWLVKAHMEPNAQQALVTSFGYVAAAIAILVVLAFAGISLTHLTIVAGALSVGIGFGLQNIVNNFVSGIIMLVERPVRHGDWIVVGSTEGLVERISIRTTTIRTFDRADIIVPNSDMISSQVTNWTLGSTLGRIKIPIGVGYSSDVETVMATLLELANNHPDVVKGDPQVSDPYVLFLEFGDSSLNFELRAHIGNINRCMHVISDLNRAINTEFNKKGIEIPFPQRDVHFRNSIQVAGAGKGSPDVTGGGELPGS